MYYFTHFSLKFKSNLLVKSILFLKAVIFVAIPNLICLICYQANHIAEIYVRIIT